MTDKMRDRHGEFSSDWSKLNNVEPPAAAERRVELLPYDRGDARVPSLPCDELFVTAAGTNGKVDRGIFALRIGNVSIHRQFDVAQLRLLGRAAEEMAALIEAAQ